MSDKIKIVIADDHVPFANALKDSLEKDDDFWVIRIFDNLSSLKELLHLINLDLLILDINFKGKNSLDIINDLISPVNKFHVVILTYEDREYVKELARKKGVNHFLIKGENLNHEFRSYIKKVALGELVELKANEKLKKIQIGHISLTKLKIKILQSLYENSAHNESYIARQLGIKESTLKTHKRELFEITNTKKITDLIKFGIEQGLILV